MQISAISFEIRDFKTGHTEDFLVENTEWNYSVIAAHRFTRNIRFIQVFDFQFEKTERKPKCILFAEAVDSAIEAQGVAALDDVDEMVGIY